MDILLKGLYFKADRINDINGSDRRLGYIPVDHPEILIDIQVKGINRIGAEMMRFTGQDIYVLSVIPIESEIGGDPCISPAVLHDIIYKAVGQSGFGADMFDFPTCVLAEYCALHHQHQHACGKVSKPAGIMQCKCHTGIGLIKDKHTLAYAGGA